MLYLLDPDVDFLLAENIARTLVNYDTIKPFIIVGIGYQDQDLSTIDSKIFWDKWTLNRARDYIPMQLNAGIEDFEGGDHEYKGLAIHTGGSEKFKYFIEFPISIIRIEHQMNAPCRAIHKVDYLQHG